MAAPRQLPNTQPAAQRAGLPTVSDMCLEHCISYLDLNSRHALRMTNKRHSVVVNHAETTSKALMSRDIHELVKRHVHLNRDLKKTENVVRQIEDKCKEMIGERGGCGMKPNPVGKRRFLVAAVFTPLGAFSGCLTSIFLAPLFAIGSKAAAFCVAATVGCVATTAGGLACGAIGCACYHCSDCNNDFGQYRELVTDGKMDQMREQLRQIENRLDMTLRRIFTSAAAERAKRLMAERTITAVASVAPASDATNASDSTRSVRGNLATTSTSISLSALANSQATNQANEQDDLSAPFIQDGVVYNGAASMEDWRNANDRDFDVVAQSNREYKRDLMYAAAVSRHGAASRAGLYSAPGAAGSNTRTVTTNASANTDTSAASYTAL